MEIAIISDSHDNLANLKKAAYLIHESRIKTIIHCGDVCGNESLKILQQISKTKIYLTLGNADNINMGGRKSTKVYQGFGKKKIGNRKIAFCHFPEIARELALENIYDIVFYGHSHKPWEETVNKTKLVNPGNLAGIFYQASFATYNTANNELKLKILSKMRI